MRSIIGLPISSFSSELALICSADGEAVGILQTKKTSHAVTISRWDDWTPGEKTSFAGAAAAQAGYDYQVDVSRMMRRLVGQLRRPESAALVRLPAPETVTIPTV